MKKKLALLLSCMVLCALVLVGCGAAETPMQVRPGS